MPTVSIVYFSQSGTTALLAEAVAEGARSIEGTEVNLVRITGDQIIEGRWQNDEALARLSASDAIVFGSPTFLGNVAAQFKAFMDATGGIWYTRGWKDKLAGGFSVSGSPSGDKLNTLYALAAFAAQHGMTWVSQEALPDKSGAADALNRAGSFIGVTAQNTNPPNAPASLHAGDLLTGKAYGRRIADLARRFEAVAA